MNAFIALRTVHAEMERQANQALYRHGLTVAQYTVLNCLADGGEKSMRAIARETGVTPQTVHSVTGALLGMRMVERIYRKGYGRVIPMIITDEGKSALFDAAESMAKADEAVSKLLGTDATDALRNAAHEVSAQNQTPGQVG